MHIDYKSSASTVEFLFGWDKIGVTWAKAMLAPFPGSISDPVAMSVSNILACISQHSACKWKSIKDSLLLRISALSWEVAAFGCQTRS
jgi:hypothetical protein